MNTIFMISEKNETSDPQRLLLNFTDKVDIKIYCFIKSQYLLYMEKYRKEHGKVNKNNKSKISALTLN